MEDAKTIITKKIKNYFLRNYCKKDLKNSLNYCFLKPFRTGVSTFLVFLIITITIDYIVNVFSDNYKLKITIFTLLISFVGFLLGFAYRLLETKKNKL